MNNNNGKYFCLLKGDWQERFFELISMFQVSLHEKFVIGVPEKLNNEFNRILIHGISVPGKDGFMENNPGTEEGIPDFFYDSNSKEFNTLENIGSISVSERSPNETFRNPFSRN
ncbi:MAG TPA: hypothetical protein VK588_07875 [Chitinophagaceae bacterium]|nr:hypothetical protein [Chitinophagaceae bacterium]